MKVWNEALIEELNIQETAYWDNGNHKGNKCPVCGQKKKDCTCFLTPTLTPTPTTPPEGFLS